MLAVTASGAALRTCMAGRSEPACHGRWKVADSGFTTVQVRCRLTARWLRFNRATKTRAEGLGLLASISNFGALSPSASGQFSRQHLRSSAARHYGDSGGTGGWTFAKSPLFIYAEAPRTWRLSLRWRW